MVTTCTSTKVAQDDFFIQGLPNHWQSEQQLLDTLELLREFRLLSLKSAPHAFASTYDQEILFPQERWIQRLQNPNLKHLVLLPRSPDGTAASDAYQRVAWVGGIVVVKTPLDGSNEYDLAKASQDDHPLTRQTLPTSLRYRINALFVDPSATGQGFGRRLIQEALKWIEIDTETQGLSTFRVEILVDTWNTTAIQLYASCGFRGEDESDHIIDNEHRRALTMSIPSNVKTAERNSVNP